MVRIRTGGASFARSAGIAAYRVTSTRQLKLNKSFLRAGNVDVQRVFDSEVARIGLRLSAQEPLIPHRCCRSLVLELRQDWRGEVEHRFVDVNDHGRVALGPLLMQLL